MDVNLINKLLTLI